MTNNFCCKTLSLIQCLINSDTTQTHSLTTQMAPKWMVKTRNICGRMNTCADLLAHQQEKRSCKTNWQNNLVLRYFGTSLRSMCRVRTAIQRELNEIPFQTVPLSSLFNSQKMNFQSVCCFVTQLKSIDSVKCDILLIFHIQNSGCGQYQKPGTNLDRLFSWTISDAMDSALYLAVSWYFAYSGKHFWSTGTQLNNCAAATLP